MPSSRYVVVTIGEFTKTGSQREVLDGRLTPGDDYAMFTGSGGERQALLDEGPGHHLWWYSQLDDEQAFALTAVASARP